MRVFGDAVDRGYVTFGGGVSDRSSVRRPHGIVFTASGLSDLPCLAAEINGKDVGVVVCVWIGFAVRQEKDLITTRAEGNSVIVKRSGGQLLWNWSLDVNDPHVRASIVRE